MSEPTPPGKPRGRRGGRKPGPHAPYDQHSVQLSVEAWQFIAMYQLFADARSESDALERLLRSHPLFVNSWLKP